MSRVATKPPMGQKPPKAPKPERKGMRRTSKKRAAYRASPEGQEDLAYMGHVKTLACAACGKHGPSDAHHCKDKPPFGAPKVYVREPIGCKSHDRDTIPLCKPCHQDSPLAYHESPASWNKRNGPDYTYILATRAAVAALLGEIDF